MPLDLFMGLGLRHPLYFCAATTELCQVFSSRIHQVSEVVRFRMR